MRDTANYCAVPLRGRKLNRIIRKVAREHGIGRLREADLAEIANELQAHAESSGVVNRVWYRVALIQGGIEIALYDDKETRVRITAGNVEVVTGGSATLFFRSAVCQPMAMPANVGNLKLLQKYLNVDPISFVLLIAWITFILAHPKVASTKFVILQLIGGQGSGKSWLCYLLLLLIDPSVVGLQHLPNSAQDLAIAAQNAHLLCFDNVRGFAPAMADVLCIAATGGALSTRMLYTDAEQSVLRLHVALILNGIHPFIDQPDLAQRCLPIRLNPLTEGNRKAEADLLLELNADLPAIQRGIFDLIAEILLHLPSAQVINPERMIDFSKWLAALELAYGVPAGVYQAEYSYAIHEGQLDALQENALAAALLAFAGELPNGLWSGTPAELLFLLNARVPPVTLRSRDWPHNPIAMSKRLVPLQTGLQTQGLMIDFGRGKFRTITIRATLGSTK